MKKGAVLKPKNHTVIIKVDEEGNIDYKNGFLRVYPGDTIVWECEKRCPFSIHIGWDSPLDKGRYQSIEGENIEAVVPNEKGTRFGHYEYSVAVFTEGKIKDKDMIAKAIWTDDPPLIVQRPPR
ncbi:MAG: hypothetical protein ISS41_05745 [Candidatus Aminicenantes bacterium]|nr:hypothetical protein [Candidatus Aminicenantes bacterium]